MKQTWIAIALAGVIAGGCKGNTSKHGPGGEAPAAAARAPIKPLPGAEAVQSLLTGVGRSAAPAAGTATALGGLFGQGGVLGGGPSLGMGVTGPGGGGGAVVPRSGGDGGVPRSGGVRPGGGPLDHGVPVAGDPDHAPASTRPIARDDDDPDRAGDDTADPRGAGGDDGDDPPPSTGTTPPPVVLPPPATRGGDCRAVATRVGDLARAMMDAQLATVDAEARAMAEGMVRDTLASIPPMIERACTTGGWPQELKDCLLVSTDLDALQACERFVTPAMQAQMQAEAAAAAPAARPSTPAPAWDGGSTDCAATAAHAAALARWELSVAPADVQAQAGDLVGQMQAGIEAACTGAGWSEAQRRCVLTAASFDATGACAP